MKIRENVLASAITLVLTSTLSFSVYAEDAAAEAEDAVIEEVVTIGSRNSKPRTASDSTVPVDVLTGDDFSNLGGSADLTDNLKSLVPSYTATPATGDGSAFVRPTSLRGTSPDQSLVLVNGKRRHRSALVQFFAPAAGNGAHGVDIGMIPGIAVKQVEILRDGAAAQYGSDAIAGVINFVLKDDSEGGEFQIQYGQHYEGEQSVKVAANAGFAVGDSGFVNLSIENVDNDALSRGIIRPDAQALLDAGVSGVGADSPFGDAPFTQTWGRPETSGTRFFMNSGFDISDSAQLYMRLGMAETTGRYRFFYRNPGHSTISALNELGFTGLQAGFTPFLDGDQEDLTFVMGVEGEYESGMSYDFSYGYGKNVLDYFLNNTINTGLGLTDDFQIPQMDFEMGGYEQIENNLNADFSIPMSDSINLAFGAEMREETYVVVASEPNASIGAGPSGMSGIAASDAGEYSRDNISVYADVEHDVTDELLIQYALRYENFSDFGSTVNGKLAGRYRVNEGLAFRGAVSTGFHAPTPGQANIQTIITTFDGATGLQVEEGLLPSTHPLVIAAGGTEMKEETSFNLSLGFTMDIGENTTLTADAYSIAVDDRIYRTGDITVPGQSGTISFYTNALDVEHTGVDIVVTSEYELSDNANTVLSAAYAYNKIDVTGQQQINGVNPVSDSLIEDIENNYPNHRFVATANTFFGENMNLMLRANFYGEHYDERGTIGAATSPSALIGSTLYFDVEFGYQVTENFKMALGAVNVFDEFIDEVGEPNANRLSVGLQYPRRSAANYEGGSWYLRGTYNW